MVLVCARTYRDFETYLDYKCSTPSGCNRKDYKYLSSINNIRGYSGPEISIILLSGWWEKFGPEESDLIFAYANARKIPISRDNGFH